jgi:hypothetical protein
MRVRFGAFSRRFWPLLTTHTPVLGAPHTPSHSGLSRAATSPLYPRGENKRCTHQSPSPTPPLPPLPFGTYVGALSALPAPTQSVWRDRIDTRRCVGQHALALRVTEPFHPPPRPSNIVHRHLQPMASVGATVGLCRCAQRGVVGMLSARPRHAHNRTRGRSCVVFGFACVTPNQPRTHLHRPLLAIGQPLLQVLSMPRGSHQMES